MAGGHLLQGTDARPILRLRALSVELVRQAVCGTVAAKNKMEQDCLAKPLMVTRIDGKSLGGVLEANDFVMVLMLARGRH